jgi:fermentation-respiration switch protein FrsA (DUF1100 family)
MKHRLRSPAQPESPRTGMGRAARGPGSRPVSGAAARWLAGAASLMVSACGIDSRLLYFPQPHSIDAWRETATRLGAEPVALHAPDGATLRGWLRPATRPSTQTGGRSPALLYLGGNAEEVSWMVGESHRMPDRVLLAVNYRGYGASTGRPHERTLYADAVVAYDWLAGRPDVDATRIVVWGRSLGSGVATWVAAQRDVEAVVLSAPFDSIAALARLHQPMLAPLLTQPFDSLSRAGSIDAPALMLVGDRDTLVPPEHSERLAAAWGGPARVVRLRQAGHNDLQDDPEHWRSVVAFLRSPGGGGR